MSNSNHSGMNSKRRWKRKAKMFDECGGRCFYCGRAMILEKFQSKPYPADLATFDHIIPIVKGGHQGRTNLVLACYACNQERGSRSAFAFLKVKQAA